MMEVSLTNLKTRLLFKQNRVYRTSARLFVRMENSNLILIKFESRASSNTWWRLFASRHPFRAVIVECSAK